MLRNCRTAWLAALIIVASAPVRSADSPLSPPSIGFDRKTEAQLAAEWWQWAASVPGADNPVRDVKGTHCAVGQKGSVWFLAGGFGSSKIRRSCTLPAGKTLFFPIINMAYWPREANNGYTCEMAKSRAALNNDSAMDLFAEIDGVAVREPKHLRISTDKCFNLYGRLPASDRPYDAFPAATDGFWLLLAPLPPGRHLLKFGGRYNRQSESYGQMVQDIEYELVVQ